ncbi:hypothetical protein KAI46_11305, partial [bacterium]|nr:hypothetical protein [bacterium]
GHFDCKSWAQKRRLQKTPINFPSIFYSFPDIYFRNSKHYNDLHHLPGRDAQRKNWRLFPVKCMFLFGDILPIKLLREALKKPWTVPGFSVFAEKDR